MASTMRSRTHGSSAREMSTSSSVDAPVAAAAASLSTAPLLEVGESTPGGSTHEPTAVRPGGGKAAAAATAACFAPALLLDAADCFVCSCCCILILVFARAISRIHSRRESFVTELRKISRQPGAFRSRDFSAT